MEHKIKLITYNIDGLPEYLDLNTLPWILNPIAWIYKLFKGTTLININDNHNISVCTKYISKWLSDNNADIIGVQEDFNYHAELMESLSNSYATGTYTGDIELSKLFSRVEFCTHFPLPRFKVDGLELIANSKNIKILEEKIIKWNKSYGYFSHANDLLTHKGYRFYSILIDGEINLDLYIVHMDADFYNQETCPNVDGDIEARNSELTQLKEFIENRYNAGNNNPTIIMGDTNCYNKYDWDVNTINEYLLNPINAIPNLSIKEAVPTNFSDADRLFYINNENSKYNIVLKECYYGDNTNEDIGRLSDHKPLISVISLETK
jgi:exonuclease III